jgi:hypothetical protein
MKWPLVTAAVILICSAGLVSAPTAAADDLQTRVAAADDYLATRPGSVGYVLRDRATGATYRNSHSGDLVWTASVIKLAMVVDLLTRARAGTIALTDSDQGLMAAMMHSSDDDAADTLWSRYGGPDHMAYNTAFPRYGMTDLQPQKGFSNIYPYWGFQKSTANDLDRLMNYVLTRLDPAQTSAIVYELQNVAPNQRWGGLGRRTRYGSRQQGRLVVRAGRLGHQLGRLRRPRSAIHAGHDEFPSRRRGLRRRCHDDHPPRPDPAGGARIHLTNRGRGVPPEGGFATGLTGE